jgi:hypothetical protein
MSRIPLRPVASPVDTFARPEVRASSGGSKAYQISQALSNLNPALSGLLRDYQTEANQEAVADAQRVRMEKKIESQAQLKDAVSKGLIKPSDNPWWMHAMRVDVSAVEAKNAIASAQMWYDSDEATAVRDADDIEPLKDELNARFGELLKGRSAAELEAMMPQFQQASERMVGEHLNYRTAARKVDRQFTTEANARTTAAKLQPEMLEDDGAMGAIAEELTNQLVEATRTMPEGEAAKLIAGGVLDNAELMADDRALGLLDKIQVGGKTLSQVFGKDVQQTKDRIEYRLARREQQSHQLEAAAREDALNTLGPAIKAALDEGNMPKAKQLLSQADFGMQVDLLRMLESMTGNLSNAEERFKAVANSAQQQKIVEAVIAGHSNEDIKTMFETYALMDLEGAHKLKTMLDSGIGLSPPAETRPEVQAEWGRQFLNGTLNEQWLNNQLLGLNMSSRDYREAIEGLRYMQQNRGVRKHLDEINYYGRQLSDQIVDAHILRDGGGMWDFADGQGKENQLRVAISDFSNRALSELRKLPQGSSEEDRQKVLEDIRDATAKEYKAYTYEEWKQAGQIEEKKLQALTADARYYDPADIQVHRDSRKSGVSGYKLRGMKTTIQAEQLPRMFKDMNDFQTNWETTVRKLGLNGDLEAQRALWNRQHQLLKGKTTDAGSAVVR